MHVHPEGFGIRLFLIFGQIFLLLDSTMKTRIRMCIWLFAALAAAGCSGGKTRLPRHAKEFASVYADLARMRERIPLSDPAYGDSARALLKKRNITPADFKKTVDYFNESPERWALFYGEVRKILLANKSSAAAPR
jgi:hypothetical protein